MKFDPTITLDSLLTAASIIIVLLGVGGTLWVRLTRLETMITPIWEWWNKEESDGNGAKHQLLNDKIDHSVRAIVNNALLRIAKEDRERREGLR
jgi:hypothetical protein